MQDETGRHIWWAWIHEKRNAEAQAAAGWAGVMSFPNLLSQELTVSSLVFA
jgi:hypothetical protein